MMYNKGCPTVQAVARFSREPVPQDGWKSSGKNGRDELQLIRVCCGRSTAFPL
jgi:hypothetical protein